MIRKLKIWLGIVLVLFVIFLIVWGFISSCAAAGRWFNWKFGYEAMVEKKVKEMVKPNSLKERSPL